MAGWVMTRKINGCIAFAFPSQPYSHYRYFMSLLLGVHTSPRVVTPPSFHSSPSPTRLCTRLTNSLLPPFYVSRRSLSLAYSLHFFSHFILFFLSLLWSLISFQRNLLIFDPAVDVWWKVGASFVVTGDCWWLVVTTWWVWDFLKTCHSPIVTSYCLGE